MNSYDNASVAAVNYAIICERLVERAIRRAAEEGVKAGMEYITQQQAKHRTERYDRRLRNTRLLLKNYRSFKNYAQGAVYRASQMKENAIDVLDELDDFSSDDDLYIESIKKSQQRTLIILKHIDEMLRYYRIECEESHKDEEMRRYRIIMAYYIDEERLSADQIAENEYIERRTLYKDINIALKPLAALIFGVDSIKLY